MLNQGFCSWVPIQVCDCKLINAVSADSPLVSPLQPIPAVMNSPLEINNVKLVNILNPKLNFALWSLAFGL